MKKHQAHLVNQETTFSQLLGQPADPRDEPPRCAAKMGIEDAYIFCQVRVYSKYRLLYEFKRSGIHEKLFSRKSYHRAGRQFEHYLGILREIMSEQFHASLEKVFGWVLRRGGTRQTQLIFLLSEPGSEAGPAPALTQAREDYQI